ncbi:MAG: HIT family protein [Rickettsiaceae bacterium]|nr:HIT family protein [Rickettsiaceae bacterium]MCP5378148.1 HIT family protein [Rickettsiaceae bacterium]
MSFKLDPILKRDSHYLTELKLCQIRLMDNSNYPWLILVPMKNNIIEITDFEQTDYDLFNSEIRKVAKILQNEFKPDKLNIATIGNVVPQMHVHIIARFKNDKLFPKTVWGSKFLPYDEESLKAIKDILVKAITIY